MLVCCLAALLSGLLPNGNFEEAPAKSQLNGTQVMGRYAIPHWEISGFVEYIGPGQKQGDMILPVPEGAYAVRLGNEASIRQRLRGAAHGVPLLTHGEALPREGYAGCESTFQLHESSMYKKSLDRSFSCLSKKTRDI